jgi:hypothetical protein
VFCLSLEWFGTKIKFEIEIKISTETLLIKRSTFFQKSI